MEERSCPQIAASRSQQQAGFRKVLRLSSDSSTSVVWPHSFIHHTPSSSGDEFVICEEWLTGAIEKQIKKSLSEHFEALLSKIITLHERFKESFVSHPFRNSRSPRSSSKGSAADDVVGPSRIRTSFHSGVFRRSVRPSFANWDTQMVDILQGDVNLGKLVKDLAIEITKLETKCELHRAQEESLREEITHLRTEQLLPHARTNFGLKQAIRCNEQVTLPEDLSPAVVRETMPTDPDTHRISEETQDESQAEHTCPQAEIVSQQISRPSGASNETSNTHARSRHSDSHQILDGTSAEFPGEQAHLQADIISQQIRRHSELSNETQKTLFGSRQTSPDDGSAPTVTTDTSLASKGTLLRSNSRKSLNKFRRDSELKTVGALRLEMWNFLSDPDSSPAAKFYSLVMNPFYVVTMLVAIAQHTTPPIIQSTVAAPMEIIFETIFAADIFLRFIVCPSKSAFVKNGFNFIDFLSAGPLLLRMVGLVGYVKYDHLQSVFLCTVPLFRLLKLQRRFEKFHLVYTAFLVSFEALPVLLYTLCVVILAFSVMIYTVESRDTITNFPMAIWCVIVTVSTVGYGQTVPSSTPGKIITSALIFLSMPLLAIPVGIVGNAFNRVWVDRRRLLLVNRTRNRLQQWGYEPKDIPNLFSVFGNTNGLDIDEFMTMMTEMKIGMSDAEIWELFKTFDEDGGGIVEPEEFVGQIFPEDFAGMYIQRLESLEPLARSVSTERPPSERLSAVSVASESASPWTKPSIEA